MNQRDFENLCINMVMNYVNSNIDPTDKIQIGPVDVYIVWMCKTLQNNKALVSTSLPDGMYYEITRNGDTGEVYLDAYKKWANIVYIEERPAEAAQEDLPDDELVPTDESEDNTEADHE